MIQVRKLQIPGLPTQKPRRLYLYTPREYPHTDRRYPVLYMFDGHNVFYDRHATYGKSWGMKEYLEKTKLPLIVAAIECNPEGDRRLHEYSPWDFQGGRNLPRAFEGRQMRFDGLGKQTMDWMIGWLKPKLDRELRTLPDRAHTLLAGSSMGGLMTLWGVLAYNEVFSKGAALSPSLWAAGRHMTELIKSRPLTEPTQIYMDIGSAEVPPKWKPRMMHQVFTAARDLAKAGADVACRSVPGALHNEAAWEKRIPVFMDYLCAEFREEDRR